MKKVLIIGTGGTIVAEAGENGLEPRPASPALKRFLDELRGTEYDIDYIDLLNLDSSNIQSEEWQLIAENVYREIDNYDGIIITHGTDTMAYTASMLSFMIQNPGKCIVLTGSQIPLTNPLSDARINLATALAAISANLPGVYVAFNRRIIRGCRAVKVRTLGIDAFESVNAHYVGEMLADGLHIYDHGVRTAAQLSGGNPVKGDSKSSIVFKPDVNDHVFLLKLIPSTNPEIFDAIFHLRYRGIVIEAFGAGGLHFIRRDLAKRIKSLVENGVAVVICSQCLYERSDISIYEVGRKIMSLGVIPGLDMTTEAAVTKLMWALGQTSDLEEIRRIFGTNIAGEITIE